LEKLFGYEGFGGLEIVVEFDKVVESVLPLFGVVIADLLVKFFEFLHHLSFGFFF